MAGLTQALERAAEEQRAITAMASDVINDVRRRAHSGFCAYATVRLDAQLLGPDLLPFFRAVPRPPRMVEPAHLVVMLASHAATQASLSPGSALSTIEPPALRYMRLLSSAAFGLGPMAT